MTRKTALTADQVRQRLRQRGTTITRWAEENGFDIRAVYRVLSGSDKAHYGRAHNIAVALGMKLVDEEPSTAANDRNMRRRAVG